jgi:hypothetical protein
METPAPAATVTSLAARKRKAVQAPARTALSPRRRIANAPSGSDPGWEEF